MHFKSIDPPEHLKNLVKEFWIYENEETEVFEQKIIPDGFSEIIVHYAEPYQINLNGEWEQQSNYLFSSQISRYFFLRNTGKSGMVGIKLLPAAFHSLFSIDMSATVDQVFDLDNMITEDISELKQIRQENDLMQKIGLAESWITKHLNAYSSQDKVDLCLNLIFEKNGMIDITELADHASLSVRQLERLFKKAIGLTPKFYCRIIRFNYIFEVIKNQKESWIRTALQSGYFDQSHFIKNFKEFTGEEPSNYGFNDKNLANFFLQR